MKYELNDKPGILPMLMYGLQWWIVSLPCVVIMGIIMSQLHYTDVAEQTFYLQKLFGIMGIDEDDFVEMSLITCRYTVTGDDCSVHNLCRT